MKFPSIKTLVDSFKNTLLRFPIEVLFALVGTIAATINIELESIKADAENWCLRIIMISNLGLLLSLAATLFTDSRHMEGSKKWYIKILAAILAVALLFIIDPGAHQSDTIRFVLLSLAFHLLVAFAAFTGKGHINGFWQFNKTLFLRFLTSALYGGVLYLGIAAAIGAMNLLFNFKFEWDTFVILWIWIVGIFCTIFFLAGLPKDVDQLDSETDYPKGLKVFTQYVLIPLATVYVVILLAYEAKILITWNLPKGLVSNLILGYAVFGILSLLLVYPIRERDENKWLKTFARSFYFLLLPLLALLFVAVGARVLSYGITEYRYFLILLAVWLLFISVYFLAFKKQNIKIIPISLALATLLSIYGPQSAFSVSLFSQRQILIHLFEKNQAYKQGKLIPVDADKISAKDGKEIVAKLQYLIKQHGLNSLQPYLNEDLNALNDSLKNSKSAYTNMAINRYELPGQKLRSVATYLGLKKYTNSYGADTAGIKQDRIYQFNSINGVTDIGGYDYMIRSSGDDSSVIKLNGESFRRSNPSAEQYLLQIGGEKVVFNAADMAAVLLKRRDLKKYKISKTDQNPAQESFSMPDSLVFTKEIKNYKVAFKLDNFRFSQRDGKGIQPMYLSGIYLIKKK
jgi:hypothetical protein